VSATSDPTVPAAALACVEAAREHLRYGELMEARTLLTEAGTLLGKVILPRARRATNRS
jgi:hypothetical protein